MLDKVFVTYVLSGQYFGGMCQLYSRIRNVLKSVYLRCVSLRTGSPLSAAAPGCAFCSGPRLMVLKPVQPPGFPLQYQPVRRDSRFNM